MNEVKKRGCTHVEGFCLMWYMCSECGHTECIWNSRDGVTPFCVDCPSCGNPSLMHVAWRPDEFVMSHELNLEQRFFRDGTRDEAIEILKRRQKLLVSSQWPMSDSVLRSLINEIGTERSEFQNGWPMLDRETSGGS